MFTLRNICDFTGNIIIRLGSLLFVEVGMEGILQDHTNFYSYLQRMLL